MTDELLLAIDVGTGSCRAVLFGLDGHQFAIAQREYSHPALPNTAGSQVFDTDANWRLICSCVHQVLSSSPSPAARIAAVSAASMREGMVLYDAGGSEIWACPNVDSRASEEAADLVRSGMARRIYDVAGDWVSITAPARFRWIARHQPEVFAAIAHVGMLGDWVLTRLTGNFVTDPSLGSSSGMFDLTKREWSERVLEICELDASVFPPVVNPGTAIGAVTARAAAETGLAAGTPVVVGGADTQLALVGLGAHALGRFTIVGGSFWQHTALLNEPVIDPNIRLRTLCHTEPGQWMLEGIGFYSGLVMRWFRDAFCRFEREEARRAGVDAYVLLERAAAEMPPGSNGIFGVFSNLMRAERWVHASPAFIGFDIEDPERSGTSACVRCIEESAAYVSRGHLRVIEEITSLTIEEAVFAGGAANGTLWPQILADVLDMPVHIPHVKEATALGTAIYAGVGAGLFTDAQSTAGELVRFERTFEPQADAVTTYKQLYERWLELYDHSLRISDAGLVRPLWRAAGT